MVVVQSFAVRADAEASRGRLEGAGVPAQLLEEPAPPLPEGQDSATPVAVFHVAVAEEDRARAEKILAES